MYIKIVLREKIKNPFSVLELYIVERNGETVKVEKNKCISLINDGFIDNARVVVRKGVSMIIGKNCTISTKLIDNSVLQDTSCFYYSDFSIYFDREVYKKMIEWAEHSNKILFLYGERCVGKTYLAEKLGLEHFKNVVKVDFCNKRCKELFSRVMKESIRCYSFDDNFFVNVFKNYSKNFTNDENTIIILDDIHFSADVYNLLWRMQKTLKCKIAVTFSYGISLNFLSLYKIVM